MYDITTGTGDFIADGVVSHNCFARPTHEYLGLNLGEDFDRKIVVKINAVERVRAELAEPTWTGEPIAMGTNTDPYQRCEAKYRITRGVLEALTKRANPFSILTKSPLVMRDFDLLAEAASRADVQVNFSIGTLDERVWRATEPGTPHPRRRVDAMRQLAEAGIRTGALVAPVVPGMSDHPDQLAEVAAAIPGQAATCSAWCHCTCARVCASTSCGGWPVTIGRCTPTTCADTPAATTLPSATPSGSGHRHAADVAAREGPSDHHVAG